MNAPFDVFDQTPQAREGLERLWQALKDGDSDRATVCYNTLPTSWLHKQSTNSILMYLYDQSLRTLPSFSYVFRYTESWENMEGLFVRLWHGCLEDTDTVNVLSGAVDMVMFGGDVEGVKYLCSGIPRTSAPPPTLPKSEHWVHDDPSETDASWALAQRLKQNRASNQAVLEAVYQSSWAKTGLWALESRCNACLEQNTVDWALIGHALSMHHDHLLKYMDTIDPKHFILSSGTMAQVRQHMDHPTLQAWGTERVWEHITRSSPTIIEGQSTDETTAKALCVVLNPSLVEDPRMFVDLAQNLSPLYQPLGQELRALGEKGIIVQHINQPMLVRARKL